MKYREFREVVQKGQSENYLIDKYVFRKISAPGTFLMSKVNATPNIVTLGSLICSIAAAGAFLQTGFHWQIAGCIGAFAYHYLDHVDGELARLYAVRDGRRSGLSGMYWDVLCHSYSVPVWVMAIAFQLHIQLGSQSIAILGIAAAAGTSSFPRLVGFKVLATELDARPERIGEVAMTKALGLTSKKRQQVRDVQAGIRSKNGLIKFVAELVGYPGMILLVICAVLIDAVLGTVFARTALLAGLALIHLAASANTAWKLGLTYRSL